MGILGILLTLVCLIVTVPISALAACTYAAGTISCRVAVAGDDCAGSTRACEGSSSGILITNPDNARYFARFQVNVPKNATVTSAYLTGVSNGNYSSGTGYVGLLDSSNQGAVTCTGSTTWDLPISGSEVSYDPASWTSEGTYNIPADADGIKSLIQSWIERVDYSYGSYIGLRFRTNSAGSYRIYQAYSSTTTSKWPVLVINYTGGDPVAVVYANYPHSYTKQRIKLNLYNTSITQKIKVTLNDIAVSGFPRNVVAGTDTAGDEWIEVDYTSLTAGPHVLRIAITDADNVEYPSTVREIPFTTTHDGSPTVGLDAYNNIVLNGTTPFFPISSYMTSPNALTPLTYSLKNAINTTGCIGSYPDHNAASFLDYMTRSDTAGFRHLGPHRGSYWTANNRKYVLMEQSFSETFEGTGYVLDLCGTRDCWTATGSVDPDYAASPLSGSQSVELDGTASLASLTYTLPEDASRLRFSMILNETTTHAGQDIMELKSSAGSTLGKVIWNDNGTISITHGVTTKTTTATYSDGTTYYVWVDWTTASSSLIYGGFVFYINTSSTKPTATLTIPETEAVVGSSGTGYGLVHTVTLNANGSKIVYDNFTDWMDALDDYVIAGKSGYDSLLIWSWVDEPDIGGTDTATTVARFKGWSDRTKVGDTSHPTAILLNGYKFGDQKIASDSSYDLYGPGTNSYAFNTVPTPIADIVFHDYYPYEYSTYSGLNSNLLDFISSIDNLDTVLGGVQPIMLFIENGDIHDNYATSYLEVTDTNGTFTKGDTITADSGGTCVIPTTVGPSISTYVRTGTTPQLILCDSKTGTFGVGDTLTADSGGTAIYSAVSSKQPCGWARAYEWTEGPSAAQIANMLWISIIHGVKGLGYFDSFCSEGKFLATETKTALEQFKSDVTSLTAAIAGTPSSSLILDSGKTYATISSGAARVHATARTLGATTYVFASRVKQSSESPAWPDKTNTTNVSFTIPITGLAAEKVIPVYGESRSVVAGDGNITDDFTEYDVHIYQIDADVSHTVPDAPTIGTATAGNAQATVTFTPPVNDGNSTILYYTATSSPGGLNNTGASSPITVIGLTNETAYTFTVTATNAIGTSIASDASNEVTPQVPEEPPVHTAPDAPTIGTASLVDTDVVSVAFTPPLNDGNSTILYYTATSSPGSYVASEGSSPILVSGVLKGVSYTFTVTATNIIGTSSASSASNSVDVPATAPDAPIIGSVAVESHSNAVITFYPPMANPGSPITSYTVTTYPGGVEITGASSPITVTGLLPVTEYYFGVSATNAIGTSEQSYTEYVTTEPSVTGNLGGQMR